MKHLRLLALALLLALPTHAHAGYRNILVSLSSATFYPGSAGRILVTTQWQGNPLRYMDFYVRFHRASGFMTTWIAKTDKLGRAVIPFAIMDSEVPGTYTVSVFLLDRLPDGTGDGDAITFTVQDAQP